MLVLVFIAPSYHHRSSSSCKPASHTEVHIVIKVIFSIEWKRTIIICLHLNQYQIFDELQSLTIRPSSRNALLALMVLNSCIQVAATICIVLHLHHQTCHYSATQLQLPWTSPCSREPSSTLLRISTPEPLSGYYYQCCAVVAMLISCKPAYQHLHDQDHSVIAPWSNAYFLPLMVFSFASCSPSALTFYR